MRKHCFRSSDKEKTKSSSQERRGADEQPKGLIELERRCLTLREEVKYLDEKQQVLADLLVSKKDIQKGAPEKYQEKIEELKELEEQRAKEALALVQKKHKLIKWEGERERARTTQRLEASRAVGPWSGSHDNSSFGSSSSSLAFHTDEAMSSSSRMAQEVDEAMSESFWTALAKEKERDWWSIDLEGEVEKREVRGPWSVTEGDFFGGQG